MLPSGVADWNGAGCPHKQYGPEVVCQKGDYQCHSRNDEDNKGGVKVCEASHALSIGTERKNL